MNKISEIGNPLEKMNEIVQWKEIFSEEIAEMIQTEAKGPGGRPHYDYILMFKVVIIQRVYFNRRMRPQEKNQRR
jgi:hypothetical protein